MADHDDTEIFRQSLDEVKPLNHDVSLIQKTLASTPGKLVRRQAAVSAKTTVQDGFSSREYITPVKPHDILEFKRDGVQHGVYKNLRLGKYVIESRIDLHRLNFRQAREQLADFVAQCYQMELRCVLVTHGKGEYRDPPALLKSSVNCWLQQLDYVLAFHSAQPYHGGSGSTYVLFRKGKSKKAANAERFGLRGLPERS